MTLEIRQRVQEQELDKEEQEVQEPVGVTNVNQVHTQQRNVGAGAGLAINLGIPQTVVGKTQPMGNPKGLQELQKLCKFPLL